MRAVYYTDNWIRSEHPPSFVEMALCDRVTIKVEWKDLYYVIEIGIMERSGHLFTGKILSKVPYGLPYNMGDTIIFYRENVFLYG